jgi:UPF0755 protein
MSKKVKKLLIVSCVGLFVLLLLILPKVSLLLASRKQTVNKATQEFYISEFTTLNHLCEELEYQGIIDDSEAFMSVAEYKGMNKENIALGKYIIEPNTAYKTLLNGFKLNDAGNGNAEVEVDVTFNNCRDIYELAQKVCEKLMIDSATFVTYLDEDKTLKKLNFNREQLPAMFLPNTYKFYYDTDEKQFIERMEQEFKRFWNADRLDKLTKIGLKSPGDAVTLASIVVSEQQIHSDEWPIIAGLYLNRIAKGIKLQSDPTFKFCWGDQLDGVQRLLNVHRDIDCAYNTYKINGLPPGPICIPPTQAVDAVLNRDNNNYIFMMAKPDESCRHDFTINYADHERLAKIYQKWLSQRN